MRRRKRVFHYIPRAMLLSSASLAIRIRRIPVSWVTPNFLSSKNYEVDAQGCLGSDGGAAGRNGCGACAAAWYVVLSTGLHAQQATRAERIFCLRGDTKSSLFTPILPPLPPAARPPLPPQLARDMEDPEHALWQGSLPCVTQRRVCRIQQNLASRVRFARVGGGMRERKYLIRRPEKV